MTHFGVIVNKHRVCLIRYFAFNVWYLSFNMHGIIWLVSYCHIGNGQWLLSSCHVQLSIVTSLLGPLTTSERDDYSFRRHGYRAMSQSWTDIWLIWRLFVHPTTLLYSTQVQSSGWITYKSRMMRIDSPAPSVLGARANTQTFYFR